MITEDKITEIYCMADDFCKVFDAQMKKYTIQAQNKRKKKNKRLKKNALFIVLLFQRRRPQTYEY